MLNLKKSLGTALVTPFTEEGGIDYIALGRLLRMQRDAEVDFIVVLGTTGDIEGGIRGHIVIDKDIERLGILDRHRIP